MIKKITAIILTIFMLCTLSAGCQSSDKIADNKDNLMDNKEKISEKLEYRPDPVTIVVYTTYIANEFSKEVRELEGRIRDILNIKFDIRLVPELKEDTDERRAAIKKFLESGEEFDLLFTDAPARDPYLDKTFNNADLIAMGYFTDITDLLPLYAPKYYSFFSPEDLQAISCNGRIYNIPELTFDSRRPCVFVWRSMIEKYGIKEIKTFEDFENYMELVKQNEKDYYPCLIIKYVDTQMFIEPSGYVMLCGNIVYRRDDPEMKLIPWEQTDAFKEAINTIGKWIEKRYDLWSSRVSDKEHTSLISHKMLYFVSKNIVRGLVLPGDEWVPCQLYPENIISRVVPNRTVFISKNSKNVERILRFIEWINESQENYDLGSALGPDNFYYDRYDENKYHYFFDKEEYIDTACRNSPYPPHSGYNPPARLMEKISERCANFDAFFQEYDLSHMLISVEAVDEFIHEQKDKGIDNLIKELQEDLDAWRRNQSG